MRSGGRIKMTKEDIIRLYDMIPLEGEGGMWKAMFRSDEVLSDTALEDAGKRRGPHALYGSILYLLTADSVSRMHRLASDEIWHFYMGSSCELLVLHPDGSGCIETLGGDIQNGEKLTAMVPRGCWQGCRMTGEGDWALLGTTMSPAYEPSDYEDGNEELLDMYPDFKEDIIPLLARP